MRFWLLSHQHAVKAYVSLHKCADSDEPLLLIYVDGDLEQKLDF